MRSAALALIAVAAGGAGVTAAVAEAGPAHPASAVAGAARVQGHFAASGRVIAVEHVSGVRRGERFSHTWTLSGKGCRASACGKVRLEARLGTGAGAVDRLTLSRSGAGQYRWRRTVSSDTLCRTRHIHGIYHATTALNVTVSRRAEVDGVWYATGLSATWSAASGGCGAPATRFAATYAATVISGVPSAALPTNSSTTSSTSPTATAGSTTTFPSSTGTTPTVATISSTPSPTVPTTTVPRPQPETGIS